MGLTRPSEAISIRCFLISRPVWSIRFGVETLKWREFRGSIDRVGGIRIFSWRAQRWREASDWTKNGSRMKPLRQRAGVSSFRESTIQVEERQAEERQGAAGPTRQTGGSGDATGI